MPNQGKLFKTKVSSENNIMYLELRAYLGQRKPIAKNYLFISYIFYGNIVSKNIMCDFGLSQTLFFILRGKACSVVTSCTGANCVWKSVKQCK
jgi:hypothetical protein